MSSFASNFAAHPLPASAPSRKHSPATCGGVLVCPTCVVERLRDMAPPSKAAWVRLRESVLRRALKQALGALESQRCADAMRALAAGHEALELVEEV